jgi:hypothetical protein
VSLFKISGCCTICDQPCFEVMALYKEHERRPGEPKRLGGPLEGAVRVTFRLYDGTQNDQTFCAGCAEAVGADDFPEIWRVRAWTR